MEDVVIRWIIVVLGAVSISAGLMAPLAKREPARGLSAVLAYTAAGTALILTQV